MAGDAKLYIGDGVYAEDDGYGVWLSTQRGHDIERIYLEPDMLALLTAWLTARRAEGATEGAAPDASGGPDGAS